MRKILLLVIVLLCHVGLHAQCYEPNLRKADAEYAKGNYQSAYDYYQRATRCPDAPRFGNGEKAKAGMKKCYASLKVDGKKVVSITVEQKAGRRAFKVSSSRLDKDSWKAYTYSNACKIIEQNHQDNTITIEWEEYKMVGTRTFTITLYGNGVNHVDAVIKITQQGYPDEIVIKQPDEKYDTVIKGGSGISFVLLRGKYGFVDSAGKAITPIKYTFEKTDKSLSRYSWGKNTMLMKVFFKEMYGYINCQGKEVIPVVYEYIAESKLEWGVSTSVVKRDGRYGLLNGEGKEVVPCVYDGFTGGYNDEPIAFEKGDKYALFDQDGEQLTEFKYDYFVTRYSNSNQLFSGNSRLCRVQVKGRYGYLNLKGEEVITPQYEYAGAFTGNRADVGNGQKYGFINSSGKLVIPYKYKYFGRFLECGVGCVPNDDGAYYFIDSMGNALSESVYKRYYSWSDTYFNMIKNNSDTVCIYYGLFEKYVINDTAALIMAADKGVQGASKAIVAYYDRQNDAENAFRWSVISASNGDSESICILAKKYYKGKGCAKNYYEAYKWFEKAVAMGSGEAMACLGRMLWKGQGCSVDRRASRKMFHNALRAGYDDAFVWMKQLGMDVSDLKPF